jgi:hypothetical protein
MGRIWSVKSQNYRTLCPDKNGYLEVVLYAKNGKRKKEKVHRLVALAFLDNPENKPQVNHKDENPANNYLDNLEWVTAKENINYGTRTARAAKGNSKPVYCVELDKVFPSGAKAKEELGINNSHITACCKGIRKTAGGYHWEYSDAAD